MNRIAVVSLAFVAGACLNFLQAKEIKPDVYSAISEEAQEDSIKFDGIRVLGGLDYSQYKIDSGKTNKMNVIGASLGGEYAKIFKKDFILAVDLLFNLSRKSKKEGSWADIDRDFDEASKAWIGAKTATLETSQFTSDVAVKGGYQLKRYSSLIYAKLGISILPIKATCKYMLNGVENRKIDMKWRPLMISVGAERKFNSKWGGIIELGFGLGKKSSTSFNSYKHQMKLKRFDVKLMGVYSIKANL